ncbi:hypothetical protein SAMN05518672_104272 [Chitinophaga sp. CF118]|uniref:hypothetical protein n=1 Tax=Chitinophaga sp. CF118 TaxID=1884367 RepID=UPI0008E6487F|nr:hypothetical protein [Chitinophaga sp. CF118]SFE05028.1 hypothetical protein SAMN05518672_104272 [Chitinophaga sp. CF118]
MKRSIFYILLLLSTATSACAQVTVDNATWMPKNYLDARKQHPPEDSFWKTVDFSKYLSPVSSLRTLSKNISIHTYGADNFPVNIKSKQVLPGKKEWILDKPVFSGGQSALYEGVNFSLISHNNKEDLWLGLSYKDGRKDSIQFEKLIPEKAGTPLWIHANNYLSYYFKGKQFDVYDNNGQLLYNNMQTAADGTLSGVPGYKAWNIITGSTFQLTSEQTTFAGFNVSFNGTEVSLQPRQTDGPMNKPLILKEKK